MVPHCNSTDWECMRFLSPLPPKHHSLFAWQKLQQVSDGNTIREMASSPSNPSSGDENREENNSRELVSNEKQQRQPTARNMKKKTITIAVFTVWNEKASCSTESSLLKISHTQLFDFVYNSISPLWEKCRSPKHYMRQLEANSPYQRHSLAEEASLSSVLWNTVVNLAILWAALPQSNWETWLKLKRVTRKSPRLRGTESILANPTCSPFPAHPK